MYVHGERASTLEMQGTAVQNNLHVRRPAAKRKRKRKKWREDRMPDDLRSDEYEAMSLAFVLNKQPNRRHLNTRRK